MAEVTAVHQPGKVSSLYWLLQSIISNSLTLSSSYEVTTLTWRWYYGVMTIAGDMGPIIATLFIFETRYRRPRIYAADSQVILTDDFGNICPMTGDRYRSYTAAYGVSSRDIS